MYLIEERNRCAPKVVFVPHSEDLADETGGLGELVPFCNDYECLRLLDGTYTFVSERETLHYA